MVNRGACQSLSNSDRSFYTTHPFFASYIEGASQVGRVADKYSSRHDSTSDLSTHIADLPCSDI